MKKIIRINKGDFDIVAEITLQTKNYFEGKIVYPYKDVFFNFYEDHYNFSFRCHQEYYSNVINNVYSLFEMLEKDIPEIQKKYPLPKSSVGNMSLTAKLPKLSSEYFLNYTESLDKEYISKQVKNQFYELFRTIVLTSKPNPLHHKPNEYFTIVFQMVSKTNDIINEDICLVDKINFVSDALIRLLEIKCIHEKYEGNINFAQFQMIRDKQKSFREHVINL